ncbi:MAG: hypothetical protein ABL940_07220 [Bacteroidia bacterium]
MKRIYTSILFLFLSLFLLQDVVASHLSGGQITWTCKSNGKYRFKLSIYQACEGGNFSEIGLGPKDICVWNHPTINTITLQEGINREISQPGCKGPLTAIKCGNNNIGAMQEILYESGDIDLGNYTPGANGWWFTYTSCCRPGAVVNVVEDGFTLRSAMYAYQGKKAKPCYDNSPVFTELPVGIISKGQPFNYNPNSNDADWDSLTVEWGKSMFDQWVDGSFPSCPTANNNANEWKFTTPNPQHYAYSTFNAPYIFTNPIGAVQSPPEPPAVVSPPILDPKTGSFNFVVPNSVPNSMFVFTIKTTEYRSGIKIGEVYRDYLFSVYPGQLNKIPTIPKMQFNTNAIPTANGYEVNVNAGDFVDFNILTQDTINQENTLTISGLQFGTINGFSTYNPTTLSVTNCNTPPCIATAATGCGTPPCAQFSYTTKNPFKPPIPIPATGGYGQVGGFFSWQTDCNHTKNLKIAGLGGSDTKLFNTFQFAFKSIDNMCPVPGFRYQFVRINVYPTPLLPSPELRCLKVQDDGNVELSWELLDTTNSKNSFNKYVIYREGFAIDSTTDVNQGTYTDFIPPGLGKTGNTDTLSYMVLTRMGCSHRYLSKVALDTVKTLFVNAKISSTKRSKAIISWNAMSAPKLKTAHPKYEVYRKDDIFTVWTKIGETDTLFFPDSVVTCPKWVYYKVELKDSLPCTSVSNIDSLFYGDSLSIPLTLPPDIRCVDVNTNGKIQLTWAAPTQTALATNFQRFYIYRIDNPSFTFDLIDSSITNINTTTFTDAPAGGLLPPALAANGQQQAFSYYIQTRSGCNGAYINFEKDSVRSMLLTATNVLYSQNVNLQWNAIDVPLKPTAATSYDIYRTELSNPGAWNIVGSVPSNKTTYTDVVSSCDERYLYKVSIQDVDLGCLSFSSIDTVHIIDTTFLPRVIAPSLRCASVSANGNVTLTWEPSTDIQNSFYGYTIWRSATATGPFVLIDSVMNINFNSYTDVAATVNAQNQSYYYYIGTWSGCSDHLKMPPLDTLKTIKLVVSGAGAGNSLATLNWNLLHTPVLATANPVYDIFREYPVNSGNWAQVGTSTTNTFKDTVTICSGIVRYRVEAKDSLGCTSVSSFDSGLFEDKTPPNQTMLDSVSVTVGSNTTHIGWTPSASGDVVKYVIFYFNGQANIPIDTVATTFYDDDRTRTGPFADPDKYVVSYIVAAVDSCGNISGYNSNHYSMLLKGTMDNCLNQSSLSWNAYQIWPKGIAAYEIYASANGGAYTLVGTNAGDDETYVHTGLQKGYTYSYYVRAVSESYINPNSRPLTPRVSTAASNEIALICTQPRQPKFIYLTHATVVDNNTVEVRTLTDTSRYALKYRVGRSLFENGPFKEVASVPYQYSDPFISASDSKDIYTDSLSYVYNITVYDSCGNEIMTSNVGKTILLKANWDLALSTTLNWSNYVDFDKKVGTYKLFRYVDGKGKGDYVATVNGNVTTYVDDVSKFSNTAGYFCYKVIAYESEINQYGIQDSSASNLACTQHPPTLYVPNAFIPESGIEANKVFVPRGMFISPDQYEFIIFDRWGVKQFYSQTPKQSWDGMTKGEPAKQDVYVWIVRYKDQYGNLVEKNGTVTLLR